MRVFVDASVLFAAIVSPSGASRELILRAQVQAVTLVVSPYVLAEVERNLARKAPINAPLFAAIQEIAGFEVVQPTAEQIKQAADYTEPKDAPVVAAAQAGFCEYLTTFDRKHLINPPEVAEKSGLKIVTPDVVLAHLRGQPGGQNPN